MVLPIVNQEGVPDKFRHDGARPGPRLDRFLGPRLLLPLHLQIELEVDERAFFERSSHNRLSIVKWSW